MELTLGTVTGYTDTECCFTVRNQKENWVLIAQDEDLMRDWINAINSHVHIEHLRTASVSCALFACGNDLWYHTHLLLSRRLSSKWILSGRQVKRANFATRFQPAYLRQVSVRQIERALQ